MLAGYSDTPLLKKLGIKTGSSVRLFDAPEVFSAWLLEQPENVRLTEGAELTKTILVFVEWEDRLVELLALAVPLLTPAGGLWIAWPKKASKVPTDVNENRLRDLILPSGLVDNKVCAIDEKWSGLRFVWRLENRPR